VGIDHGGGNVIVAQKRLDGTDIGAPLQKMGGETMPDMPSSAYQALCRVPDYAESML